MSGAAATVSGEMAVDREGAREGRGRRAIAVISAVPTPYRAHLHRRMLGELGEFDWWFLYTHGVADQAWGSEQQRGIPEERVLRFADGGSVEDLRPWHNIGAEWRKGGRIIRELAERGVEGVILSGYADLARVRVMRWCRRNGIPILLAADSNIALDTARGVKRAVKRAIVGRVVSWCAAVLPFGTRGREFFLSYGADPAKTFLSPYEPAYDVMESVTAEEIRAAAERFALRAGRRRLVFCGRLVRLKRVDLLISAFNRLAAERPEWDLVVIGDGPLRAELEAGVDPAVRARVIWTGFLGSPREIGAVLRGCDCLVLPSEIEAWSLVVNEALVCGLATVVSSIVGAGPDLVHDGRNGRVFLSGDSDHLLVCLRQITQASQIDEAKRAAPVVLTEWRRAADPIDGLRAAMRHVGLCGR